MEEHNQNYQSLAVFRFIYKWRWHFVIVCALAAIISSIFSGPSFIKPKFKSTVIFYPSKVNSVSTILRDEGYNREDPLEFGEEEEAEQLIQILQSDEIRDSIIKKYNLMAHYEIDSNSDYTETKLFKEYAENISFRRTEYMSVEIKVMDTDPRIAAAMANDVALLLDKMKNSIQRVSSSKAFTIIEREFRDKEALVASLNDTLNWLRSKGIYDYQLQVDNLNSQYVKSYGIANDERARLTVYLKNKGTIPDSTIVRTRAKINGAESVLRSLKSELNVLQEFGGLYMRLSEELELENEELVDLRQKFQKARVDMEETLPVKFVVNHARVAEKKSYPIRWLIVVLSTLSAFVFALVALVVLENYKSITAK